MFTWLFFLGGAVATAQDPAMHLREASNRFYEADKLFLVVHRKVYQQWESVTPELVDTLVYKKDGMMRYHRDEEFITVENRKCEVLVDRMERNILYRERDFKNEEQFFSQAFAAKPDSIDGKVVSLVRVTGSQNTYAVAKSASERFEVVVDTVSSVIVSTTYFFNRDQMGELNKVELTYAVCDFNPDFRDSDFSEVEFVTHGGRGARPSPAYAHYTIQILTPDKP